MSRRLYWGLFIGITVLAFILRFYKLGEIPFGLYQDETATGYNAYSILKTGRDEFGKSFPLYFKSFGDYKLPIYIYSVVPSIALFGLTEFAVRFPSALFGFLTVLLFPFYIKDLSKSRGLALAAMLLLAINPWHIHYNRATFEVSISLFLFLAGAYLLHVAFTRERSFGYFLGGVVCFVIALYTYNLTRLLAPLILFLLLFSYKERIKHIQRLEIVISGILAAVLLIPFFTTLAASGGASSAGGTFIFSSASVQAPLLEFRSYFTESPLVLTKILFNKGALTLWQYVNNIFAYFSVPFFFITGSSHGNHGIGNVGLFYLFELPFMLLGIVRIFVKKHKWGYMLLSWAVLVVLVASLTRDVPHATRSFFLLIPMVTFSAIGFIVYFRWMRDRKNVAQKTFLLALTVIFIFYNVFYYLDSYYVRFPVLYAKQWRAAEKGVSLYIKDNEQKYSKIIFDSKAGFMYSSLLFYSAYPPGDFQATVRRSPDDSEGFVKVESFGKYFFRDIDWTKDIKNPKTLIVTTPDGKPNEVPPLKAFYYPKRPVVLAVKQELFNYPVEEIPYVLVETK